MACRPAIWVRPMGAKRQKWALANTVRTPRHCASSGSGVCVCSASGTALKIHSAAATVSPART